MSKYHNEPVRWGEISFRSKREREHALWLEGLRSQGQIKGWQYEVSYDLEVNGKLITKHKPDFTVTLPDDRQEVHEVKGGEATKTEAWRLRMKLFKALIPEIPYRVFDGRKRLKAVGLGWRSYP